MQGTRVPFIDQHEDGWQAYCAGQGKEKNPYLQGTDNYREWESAYDKAAAADAAGMLDTVHGTEFGTTRESATAAYWKRHRHNS